MDAKKFREMKGSLSEKLISSFVITDPPTSMKKITNLYYDPSDGTLKYTAEA